MGSTQRCTLSAAALYSIGHASLSVLNVGANAACGKGARIDWDSASRFGANIERQR